MPQTFLLNLPEAKNGTVRGPLQTHQLSAAFCLLAYFCFFSTSCFSLLSFMLYFFSLTACHHIFSQLPTTSYSATTDLNSDLALSVPLRREREIPYLRLPPLLPPPPLLRCRVWIFFACLISLPAAGVRLVISFQIPTCFALQLISAQTGKTSLLAQGDGKPRHIDP